MAKFLDGEGLAHLWEIIKSHVSSKVSAAKTTIDAYTVNGKKISSNPTLSKGDVGLGNVTNDAQVKQSEMGKANGVATLDSGGKVPSAQLPSYVDDVLEYDNKTGFPATGETGKIYVSKNDNKTWRWSGTTYVEISQGVTLGETSSTAYAGDKGKANRAALESLPENIVTGVTGIVVKDDSLPTGVLSERYDIKFQLDTVEKASDGISYGGKGTIAFPLENATKEKSGLMAWEDKSKVDLIDTIKSLGTISQDTTKVSIGTNKADFINTANSNPGWRWIAGTALIIPGATTSLAGVMSAEDKNILNALNTQSSKNLEALNFMTGNFSELQRLEISHQASSVQVAKIKTSQREGTLSINAATTTLAGVMSAADKAKLDGIAAGANKYTLPTATASVLGGVKLGSDTAQSVAANGVTATAGRTYAVQKNGNGQLVVNVPWTSGSYTLPKATSGALGGVKIGYNTSGKNYAVQLDSDGKMYVNVPWTDNNTTYSVATQSANGLMSSTDKKKLDGIATGATADSALSTSEIDEVCV